MSDGSLWQTLSSALLDGGLTIESALPFLILILCAVLCLALVINLFDVDSVRLHYIAHIYCKSHSQFLLASNQIFDTFEL